MDKKKLHDIISSLKKISKEMKRTPTQIEFSQKTKHSRWSIGEYGGYLKIVEMAGLQTEKQKTKKEITKQPKILVLDIETLPMVVYSWDLWPERIGLEQIIEDWSVASWSAKWLGEDKIYYEDNRLKPLKKIRDDKKMLQKIWSLIDEADIVVTQNGKSFDIKKLNARFFKHKMKPTTTFRHYDTKEMAKRYFKFTSNRLAYMTEEFNEIYKKLDHSAFPGMKLWLECMKGNRKAWLEMEEYNKHDVLSLEELFMLFLPWDKTINWNVFHYEKDNICSCGNAEFFFHKKDKTTNAGRYSRVICTKCGKEHFAKDNLLSKKKREFILK